MVRKMIATIIIFFSAGSWAAEVPASARTALLEMRRIYVQAEIHGEWRLLERLEWPGKATPGKLDALALRCSDREAGVKLVSEEIGELKFPGGANGRLAVIAVQRNYRGPIAPGQVVARDEVAYAILENSDEWKFTMVPCARPALLKRFPNIGEDDLRFSHPPDG